MLKKITDKEYFAAEGLNASSLKQFAKSPAHYKASLIAPEKKSTAFDIGTLVHQLVLEKTKGWAIVEGNRNSKSVKEMVETAKSLGKIAIKPGEDEAILKMADSVASNYYGQYLGRDADCSELAGFVEDPETGLLLKAKFDYAPKSGNILFDLKTAQDASPAKFKWSAKDFGYDIQAVHYMHVAKLCGLDYEQFIFVVVEKTAPYLTASYILEDETRERAEHKYKMLLQSFKACEDANDFSHGYDDELMELKF
ncbi:MAG: hypothetical protein GY777_13435 [Candidatus Brocadiaceae bacterium]|nr:hypothetical protein [Candidatus Brocadiaceae bacterium]